MTWRIPLGAVLIGLGIFLAVRPFTALAVLLGLTALALIASGYALVGRDTRRQVRNGANSFGLAAKVDAVIPGWLDRSRAARAGVGLFLAVLGVAAVIWSRVTYAVFAYLPLLLALGYGLWQLWIFSRRVRQHRAVNGESAPAPAPRGWERLHARPLLLGPASILLAFAGWRWPDVILMLLAVATGATLVVIGVRHLHRRGPATPNGAQPRVRWRQVGVIVALPAALGALILSGYLGSHSRPGAFYTPPEGFSASAELELGTAASPGELLRAEPVEAPEGAEGIRILYTTTRDGEATPVVASAVVYTPTGVEDAPVVAWAHGTTGQASGCAPSMNSLEAGAMYVLDDVLTAGWAIVATDYTGLGTPGSHPYLIGEGEGRSVIDAVRAAGQSDLSLGQDTVVWGHSQGGHAALWAGGLWEEYAPELPLAGVAALAPAANVPAVIDSWAESRLSNIFSAYVLSSYGQEYDDVAARDYIRPPAEATAQALAARCLDDPGTAVSLTASLLQETTIWDGGEVRGPLRDRAEENIPDTPISAPVLIAQGEDDAAIPLASQDAYTADRCGEGWELDYRTYPGLDHLPLVEPDSEAIDDVFVWTAALFSGEDVPPGSC
ncbi:MAG TPA: lipase family protein [Beutenbergiaceae bacterium]|nr:lipase family protein [Beutenbergiaceae bacterium]